MGALGADPRPRRTHVVYIEEGEIAVDILLLEVRFPLPRACTLRKADVDLAGHGDPLHPGASERTRL